MVAMAKLRFFSMREIHHRILGCRSSQMMPPTIPMTIKTTNNADETGSEPIVALTFVENDLHAGQDRG